jgi:poly(3-hydroxybutyrate) depolymerase
MMIKRSLCSLLIAISCSAIPAHAQSSVRAHYAQGQVWVTWEVQDAMLTNCQPTLTPVVSNGVPTLVSNCLPSTYAIYWSPNPVTNPVTATLVGRLFEPEWAGTILRDNLRASLGAPPNGFRIPDGAGGHRVLATNEGLFVHTVRSNFSGHYAVRPFGATTVPPNWRTTLTNAVFSLGDPPTCHLQARGTNDGYPIEWWTLWADGDTNLGAARPDYPIMENHHRRGLPHNFSLTAPRDGSLPTRNIPACVAFHSGDGQAKMWLPGNAGFQSIGLTPAGQLLVAVEDRFFSLKNGLLDAESVASTGYVPTFDPFFNHPVGPGFTAPADQLPASDALIIPYAHRRLNWTLDWLYAHRNVDSNRVALVGHSGGAKGSLLWSHASPERFAYVGLYNPALGQFPENEARLIGTRLQNLPLALTNRTGQLVRAGDIHHFEASYSPLRDLPFTRIFHGKREENWVLDENEDSLGDIAELYRLIDAQGWGAAVFWDLRKHGMDTWTYLTLSNDVAHPNSCGANPTIDLSGNWGLLDLWVPSRGQQFRRDDATNQIRHRADCSYPAFFQCALRGDHENPGSVIYTNNTAFYEDNLPYDGLVTTTECLPPWTGHARGTFGGYFDWEPAILDTTNYWSATLFLVGPASAFHPVEICPDTVRRCDVAIRRPQSFRPVEGDVLEWRLELAGNGELLTNGTVNVGPDDLVSVPNLPIPRDPARVRLTIARPGRMPEPCRVPRLFISSRTNHQVDLAWWGCPENFYQIEATRNLQNWSVLTPPLAAPPVSGWMTWPAERADAFAFFRLVVRPLTNSAVPTLPGIYDQLRLVNGGITRQYRLNIPTNYTGDAPAPLALMLHGHNQTAAEFAANQPGLARYANELGVILVIPDGTAAAHGTGWNSRGPGPEHPVDDVAFLLQLLDTLDASLNVDRQRIYAGGFSNGGQMVHRLGALTTNVFAAFASVGSAIASAHEDAEILEYQPPPSQPAPILIVNATNDCKRPFWGGINEDGSLQPPAHDAVSHWTNANLCASAPILSTNIVVTNHVRRVFAESCAGPYPPFNAMMTNVVIREHHQLTCAADTEVLFVTLSDGGHKWTEANDNVGFDTSWEALQFFLRHCRCEVSP